MAHSFKSYLSCFYLLFLFFVQGRDACTKYIYLILTFYYIIECDSYRSSAFMTFDYKVTDLTVIRDNPVRIPCPCNHIAYTSPTFRTPYLMCLFYFYICVYRNQNNTPLSLPVSKPLSKINNGKIRYFIFIFSKKSSQFGCESCLSLAIRIASLTSVFSIMKSTIS